MNQKPITHTRKVQTMQKPREEYNKAIDDCYPLLENARTSNTKGEVQAVERYFSDIINILHKLVTPMDLQPDDKD